MNEHAQQKEAASAGSGGASAPAVEATRISSADLFRQGREVEIDHQGRIYRLRLTQLNKLILTA
jgi:hemin uptake protein HemP